MTLVNIGVEVEAPPEEVWAVVSDPRNLAHWDRHIESVEGEPEDGLHVGATYTTVMRFLHVHARVHGEVLEWSPPVRAKFQLSGLLHAIVTTTVTPLPGGRSYLEHEVDYHFRGGLIGELAARSLRLFGGPQFALRHGTMAQKHEIERHE